VQFSITNNGNVTENYSISFEIGKEIYIAEMDTNLSDSTIELQALSEISFLIKVTYEKKYK